MGAKGGPPTFLVTIQCDMTPDLAIFQATARSFTSRLQCIWTMKCKTRNVRALGAMKASDRARGVTLNLNCKLSPRFCTGRCYFPWWHLHFAAQASSLSLHSCLRTLSASRRELGANSDWRNLDVRPVHWLKRHLSTKLFSHGFMPSAIVGSSIKIQIAIFPSIIIASLDILWTVCWN